MAPDALAQVLRPLQAMFPAERFPQVLVGLRPDDDAAVYKLNDELALVPLGISAELLTQVSDVTGRTGGSGCFRRRCHNIFPTGGLW